MAASTAIETRLKNTANKARCLLTGLSNANKIASRVIAQINKKNSEAILKRHRDSIDLMLAAVAAALPETMSLSRTNASSKMPRTMMTRYSAPPILA